jgi:cellobiose phosphorylase
MAWSGPGVVRRGLGLLPARPAARGEPGTLLRSELFGVTQLAEHARQLARRHEVVQGPGRERLLERLEDNRRTIAGCQEVVAASAAAGRAVAPAADWLLDNYYLIEEQIEIAKDHLPPGYSRELPRLRSGPLAGLPRVYDLMLEMVSHTDGLVDQENLAAYVHAYQSEAALKLGELWAVPIMLRVTLLENLRRVAQQIAWRREQRDAALAWARNFLDTVAQDPHQVIPVLADFVREKRPLTGPFLVELASGLRAQHPSLGIVLAWLEQQLAESGQSLDQVQQAESRDQAAEQVSISNGITSLRRLSAIDWRRFVEEQSRTEQMLRGDPAGAYSGMDFETRDEYRHVVEELARRSRHGEEEVAAQTVRLAQERLGRGPEGDAREAHVGHFLVGAARRELERALGYRPPLHRLLARLLGRALLFWYLLAVAVVTALPVAAFLAWAWPRLPRTEMAVLGLLLLLPASRSALTIVNWLATLAARPRRLPRMDFSKGIPDQCQTVVVVPTLLVSPAGVRQLVENLELRYLGNRDPNLHYALLTDLADAPRERMPGDEELLRLAARGIGELNERHASSGKAQFHLLHRPRRWNAKENCWMGWERKRGKLLEFNRLLLTGQADGLEPVAGQPAALRTARYVITLDTDTQLPRDAAAKLVGTLAHPLNQPRLNPRTRCVERGYGVLQPRTAVSLTSAIGSWFVRLYAGEVGIDPYTRQVSHVLQDLFGRAQFIGKGIYDLRAFEAAVGDRFPENAILSHDLIEGCHARCGFVNDVELIEDHPSSYLAEVSRRERWLRGDWQIAGWLFFRVRGHDGRRRRNPLDLLSRWLIFDNLRRSLEPPATLALLIAGWWVLPGREALWTLALLALWFLPELPRAARNLAAKPRKWSWSAHWATVAANEGRQVAVEAMRLVFLPYECAVHLGATARAVWRVLISRRRLLEWWTAHEAERTSRAGLAATVWAMAGAPFTALLLGAAMEVWRAPALTTVAPLLAPWLAAPFVAWLISRPWRERQARLSDEQRAFLRRLARRTWAYFEEFAQPERHWLPPDNVQEKPELRSAERTSPTNIGLGLLSTLAARDLGHLTTGQLLQRVEGTLDTLEGLRRYRGHFYNWYETRQPGPSSPVYISTVDSGNLVASLIALRQGLRELPQAPVLPERWANGLEDVWGVLAEEIGDGVPEAKLAAAREALRSVSEAGRRDGNLLRAWQAVDHLNAQLAGAESLAQLGAEPAYWLAALKAQSLALRDELLHLAPWLPVLEASKAAKEADGPVWATLLQQLSSMPTLRGLAEMGVRLRPDLQKLELEARRSGKQRQQELLLELRRAVGEGTERAAEWIERLTALDQRAAELGEMDLEFLYDPSRKLLSIGYSLDAHRLDPGCYDLLASEARLCSYVGVAQGKLPLEHWFLLGRPPATGRGPLTLLSWGGSLFEYLMPLLMLPSYPGTLQHAMCRGAVLRQIRYGRKAGLPWGLSESCYNQMDSQFNYQYRAFGAPELGLKRGLEDDYVVAPYAAALALTTLPEQACANLESLWRQGFGGRYGFYEAVDYTPGRVPGDQQHAVVRAFMAHHQGMTLLALEHLLLGRPMQRRFLRDSEMRSALLLLQERVPAIRGVARRLPAAPGLRAAPAAAVEPTVRVYASPHTGVPQVHLLGNGRYSVMVTNAGGGVSRWNDLALTRWREDATEDAWGQFFYVCDVQSGKIWSTTHQPTGEEAARYEAVFAQGRAEFRTEHAHIQTHTQIAVSPEDDVELRRMIFTNLSGRQRTIELTSYAEVSLMDPRAEAAHPALNNLFVETEAAAKGSAVLSTRRPRAAADPRAWLFHTMILHRSRPGGGQTVMEPAEGEATFDTDRASFLGRGRGVRRPRALDHPGPLSNIQGSVLDPILALRRRMVLDIGEAVTVEAVTGAADRREQALALMERYRDRRLDDRLFDLAWTHSQVLLHQLGMTEADAALFSRLAASMVFANSRLRGPASLIGRNTRGQSALWSFGVSGDVPLMLVHATDRQGLALVRQALQAHAYWRHKGLNTELFVWCDAFSGYRQALLDEVIGMVNSGSEPKLLDRPGGLFVRSTDQMSEEDRLLLQAAARVVLSDQAGTLASQLERRPRVERRVPAFEAERRPERPEPGEMALPPRDLRCSNGLGGFTPDGREYVTVLRSRSPTPAPWVNVLANHEFGAVVSESGGGYTWFTNAHEYRLTPWSNDAVCDRPGEAFYVRNEETGAFWSLMPAPAPGPTPYVCRHGLGYSAFEHIQNGVFTEVMTFVPTDAPARLWLVNLRNTTDRDLSLSLTGFCEWVLGDLRQKHAPHVVTRVDPQTGALFAGNAYAFDFPGRLAFFQCSLPRGSLTGDRTEFIGRNGSLANPAALGRQRLSGSVGAGLDPCAAIQAPVDLPAQQERRAVFVLGAAYEERQARELLQRFAGPDGARQALEAVWEFWKHTLGGVYVETPDEALNFLANNWLLYQALACRFWGRSGLYQSGGAFGFRDQLQDAMAFVHECPWLLRQHLLVAAARQFREGDVQHWWHPPTGRGVRSRCSDDLLWLPLAACRYVEAVGDTGVLDEKVPFLEGRQLEPHEESYYDLPAAGEDSASLYEHCVRAIRRALRLGAHGLPLIGSGDWNDGLNRVGSGGRGESVWLGFFLYHVLGQFAELARRRDDSPFAEECRQAAAKLQANLEAHAWDGQWYRRAFFDDGSPLGSAQNQECRIDLLPQAWAVLSGAADPHRARLAMKAVFEQLVDRRRRLVRLFTPPFDKETRDPGYIRGYLPGVRENGGHYTHAAVWAAMAMAQHDQTDQAWELFHLINPVRHGDSPSAIQTYAVEPYVTAADVYSLRGREGRGGWTWYTGSAAWLYRLIVENLLGLRLQVDKLIVRPLVPPDWREFRVHYRYRSTMYHIHVSIEGANTRRVRRCVLDGVVQPEPHIPLADDHRDHEVALSVG